MNASHLEYEYIETLNKIDALMKVLKELTEKAEQLRKQATTEEALLLGALDKAMSARMDEFLKDTFPEEGQEQ